VAGRAGEGQRGTTSVLFDRECTQFTSFQTYHRIVGESNVNSHPNVLPIIQVSKDLFPVCIMSPWMPDGNITQYTQVNPGADRLALVCCHWWIDGNDVLTTSATLARTSVLWPHAPPWVRYFAR